MFGGFLGMGQICVNADEVGKLLPKITHEFTEDDLTNLDKNEVLNFS